MSSQIRSNETGYDIWSSFYDSYPNPTVAIDNLVFPALYEEVRNQKVLEIGCGTGRHTSRLLEAKNRVTGLDISEGMLRQLQGKIADPNLNLIKGDFLTSQLEEKTFNSVVESLVLEHIFDLRKFFAISSRVLIPLGHIYLSEIHPDRTSKGVFAHFKTVDGTEVHLKSSPHTSDEIMEASTQFGFVVRELRSIVGSPKLADLNPNWKKYLGQPMIQIWKLQLCD